MTATYCIGVAECSGGYDLPRNETPYLNVALGERIWLSVGVSR